jgi:hypothetical protein
VQAQATKSALLLIAIVKFIPNPLEILDKAVFFDSLISELGMLLGEPINGELKIIDKPRIQIRRTILFDIFNGLCFFLNFWFDLLLKVIIHITLIIFSKMDKLIYLIFLF